MAKLTFFGRTVSFERRDSISNPTKWLTLAFGGGTDTAAGIRVNEVVALRNLTIMACVKVISETVAQLPLLMYRRLPDGSKQRAPEHPLQRVLDRMPNDRMTAFTFKETLMAHVLTWGNATAFIDRNNAGRPKSLYPLLPDRTRAQLNADGKLVYLTRIKNDPNGISSSDNNQISLDPQDVLHIPGLGFDGLNGYSVVAQARESIGLGLALTEYAERFFGNGAVPGFVLQTDKNLSPEQRTALSAVWAENHQGLTNAQRVAILEAGLHVEKIGIPPDDAQFLESRKFSRNELASIYRVPPHMIGDVERTTSWGSGIEQQAIGFLVYTMLPWLERWQQAINTKLLLESEQDEYFCEFLVDGLVRGDITTRYAAYNLAFGKWMTGNTIAAKENLPLLGPGGDQLYAPSGALPLDEQGDPQAPPADPNSQNQPSGDQPTSVASATFDVRRPIERLLRDVLDQTVKRERVDIVRKKKYDGEDIRTFLGGKLTAIIEAFPESLDQTWADSVVRSHVGESVTLLGAGDEIGIEAAFGTSVNRVARETAAALDSLRTTAPASTAGIVMDGMMRALVELAGRTQAAPIVNNNIAMPAITPTFTMPEQAAPIVNNSFVMPEQPITVQPAEVRVEAAVVNVQPPNVEVKLEPVINVAAPDAVATEVVYHTKGALKGAVKGQRPVKELKD